MPYIGHFSFDEVGLEQEIRHGYFTTVVNTDSIERATTEFKELIHSMNRTCRRFCGRRAIALCAKETL